jgi:hypothetical protein
MTRLLSLPLTLRAFRWNGSSCAAYEHKTAHHSAMLDRLAGLILEASHRDARHRAHWQLLRLHHFENSIRARGSALPPPGLWAHGPRPFYFLGERILFLS